ncbi:DUF1800 domain-containing protein [Undibacterium sp.]|jgi:uncharacterized protein (DUF1800 family)|uniref:DUF1800 domain-containing protein n=1 Tax=Undibacterium sp. TaxID=1914977 RepID=UPI002CDE9A54|nr:DUF1800 domain-containing protein [Undibacterium sp.]HTD05434.1 DUF1800 domain-containing protein [Undibacterium sp.]
MKLVPWLMLTAVSVTAAWPLHAAELSPEQQAVHVLNRLGYGPKPGDIQRVMQMGADRYIAQQLNPSSIPMPTDLTNRLKALDVQDESAGQVLYEYQAALKLTKDGSDESTKKRRELVGRIVEQTAEARIARAIDSPRQLEEVMVDFWFNHFNVFSGKGLDRALVASYERDAIRPYVFGSFRDLLGATAKHPAMLFYLDNWLSTSADYQPRGFRKNLAQGAKAKANGLNENYAREVMELHTLGVDGGYTQKDVTELARMLTGWTFEPRDLVRSNRTFQFDADRHDNGSKEWLGRHINAQGQREGEFALDVLAMHPATAHHLSYQLAQYFVQDNPPPALVDRMSKRYLETGGNIRAVLETLFKSPEFMDDSVLAAKYKTPYQFVISAARAGEMPITNIRPLLGTLAQLGMPLYGCQTPDGYKNTETAWMNPDALTRRINFATAIATGRLALNKAVDDGDKMGKRQLERQATGPDKAGAQAMPPLDAQHLMAALGPGISTRTRDIIANNPEALRAAMLLGSPDFMQH